MRSDALRGNTNATRKLSAEDARLIRQINADGRRQMERIRQTCTAKALAEKFGVHIRTVEKVLNYSTWKGAE